jgi:hypothetical protein
MRVPNPLPNTVIRVPPLAGPEEMLSAVQAARNVTLRGLLPPSKEILHGARTSSFWAEKVGLSNTQLWRSHSYTLTFAMLAGKSHSCTVQTKLVGKVVFVKSDSNNRASDDDPDLARKEQK